MSSVRAEAVAEILWELKRAEKLATFSSIAGRAGFSAGSNGRTMRTCLVTVRRDWPHLQWWRALEEDGKCPADSEQAEALQAAGFELKPSDDDETQAVLAEMDACLMDWNAEVA